ncbi:hypothetical protein T484DRAFT_1847555 [Baffinella frigidus]|nr:hypothetical protein T484DRAFT_1847555 [Cryptophyta sp. CCMP2293]
MTEYLTFQKILALETEYLTFQKILALEYDFPDTFPEHAQAFVKSILVIDPAARLGAGTDGKMPDYRALMAHPFFEGISWTDPPLYNQRPPRPSVHLPKEGVESTFPRKALR